MLLLALPFKTTTPILFHPALLPSLKAALPPNALPSLQASLSELDFLRNSKLEYGTLASQLPLNPNLHSEIEGNAIKLLRFEYLLDKCFNFGTAEKDSVPLVFAWNDSFDLKKSSNMSNMKFELCGHLYNFALNEYFNTVHLLKSETDQDKKLAVAKLKVGAWALSEIKNFLLVLDSSKLPSDMNRNLINVLENFFIGMAYMILLDVLEKNEKDLGIDNISTITNEASKSFKIALDIIASAKDFPGKPELKRDLHSICYILYCLSFSITCMKLQIHNELLHEDNKTKGHFGLALSYLQIGSKVYNNMLQQKVKIPDIFQKRISILAKFYSVANIENLEKRNTIIYKQKLYQELDIPLPPEIPSKIKITGTRPSAFGNAWEFEELLGSFFSKEIKEKSLEVKMLMEKEKEAFERKYKGILEEKNKIYLQNYINFHLEKNDQDGISHNFLEKRARILAKGGNLETVQAKIGALKESNFNCGMKIEEIRGKLEEEENGDRKLREKYNAQWKRIPSENINTEYKNSLADLSSKFSWAQNVDVGIIERFQRLSPKFDLISKKPEDVIKMIPKSANSSEKIGDSNAELRAADKEITGLLEEMQKKIKAFNELNIPQEMREAHKNNLSSDKIVSNLKNSLGLTKFDIINKKLSEIVIVAQKSAQNSKSSSQDQQKVQFLEELTSSVSQISDMLEDLDQGLNFYQMLTNILYNLQKNVDDYSMARRMEADGLLQEIEQRNENMNFNFGYGS